MARQGPAPQRPLPRGTNALAPDAVARIQRQRLQAGMVTAVVANGYLDTTVADVTTAASIARNTFYDLYVGKEQCFLATWEALAAAAVDRLEDPRNFNGGPPTTVCDALGVPIAALARAAIDHPDEAHVLLIDVLGLGADGPRRQRTLVRRFEQLLRRSLDSVQGETTISPSALAVIAHGVLQVVQHRLRSGKVRQLRTLARDLTTWAATYETSAPMGLRRPRKASALPQRVYRSPARSHQLPRGHNRLPRSFVDQHQRERILHAVTTLTAAEGYAGLSIPEIAASANISHRTFYEHFTNKDEAFLAAYDAAFTQLFAACWYAASEQADWALGVREGIRAWVDYVAADPDMARFGFNDVLTSGPAAADKVDESHQAFAHLLSFGFQNLPAGREVPAIVPYAIAGGIAGLVSDWVVDGRAHELPHLAPELCYIALAPFLGDTTARSTAEALQAA